MSQLTRSIQELVPEEKEIFVVDRNENHSTEKHLEKIVKNKFDRIIIAGGDGTVNRTIQFLLKNNLLQKVTLGIVPMGTCNDFARYLGLKSGKIEKAMKVILQSRTKRVSVAQVNHYAFFNNAGFGKKNPSGRKKSALRALREMEPVELRAEFIPFSTLTPALSKYPVASRHPFFKGEWEREKEARSEEVLEGKFFMMLCANAPYFSGGLHFSKNANPHDDALEFYFVRGISKARLLLRLLLGRFHLPLHFPIFSKEILHLRSSQLFLQTNRPVSIVADGEAIPELLQTTDATFQVAGQLNFLVP